MLVLTISLLAWLAGSIAPEAAPRELATPIAVLDFDNNSGNPRYDPLGKGLAAMMLTDLAAVPMLQVVERSRLADVMQELQFQQTQYVDPATAQRVGQLIGAEFVLLGSIVALEPQLQLDTRLVEVRTGEVVKTAAVRGRENRLFELQERLAQELLDGLEMSLTPEDRELLRARQEANRIEEMETMLAFSEALVYFDREDYVAGAERMAVVMRAAPQSLMVRMFYDEARSRVANDVRDRARGAAGRLLRGIRP
jgi:TolB-like protein